MMTRERCSDHARAIAGWRCQECARALCPDCVGQETLENGAIIQACSHCDGRVDQLMEPGARDAVGAHLWQVVQVPVSWPTLLLGPLTVLALWRTRGLEAAGTAMVLIFAVAPCFWALYFATVRGAARAFDLAAPGEALDLVDHVALPAGRAWVVTVFAAGPVTLVRWIGGDFKAPISNPLLWVLVVLGALLMPLWTAYFAGGSGFAAALSPARALRSMRELGSDYRTVAGWTLATASLCFAWAGVADAGVRGPVFLLLQGLALYAMLFVARFAGALLAVRGPELGFTLRPDQLRPVLPGAVPRGTRKAKPPPPAPKVIQPIELDVAPPSEPMLVQRGMGGGGGGWDPGDGSGPGGAG
jgi:hypothetical protein